MSNARNPQWAEVCAHEDAYVAHRGRMNCYESTGICATIVYQLYVASIEHALGYECALAKTREHLAHTMDWYIYLRSEMRDKTLEIRNHQ